MMIRNRISLFIATLLIIGFFFLALPEKGYSGATMFTGCCQQGDDKVLKENFCIDLLDPKQLCNGRIFPRETCNQTTGLCQRQQANNIPIPTLSEWGLIATAGILGIVGFMVIRRRKVTA